MYWSTESVISVWLNGFNHGLCDWPYVQVVILNPAVSIGLWAGGRFAREQLLPYFIAQVLGGILGAKLYQLIAAEVNTEE